MGNKAVTSLEVGNALNIHRTTALSNLSRMASRDIIRKDNEKWLANI